MRTQTAVNSFPRTTLAKAARHVMRLGYRVDPHTGTVYNPHGVLVGKNKARPTVTARLDGIKYGVPVNRLVGWVTFGPMALNPKVQVRHRDSDPSNNAGRNLEMVYSQVVKQTIEA